MEVSRILREHNGIIVPWYPGALYSVLYCTKYGVVRLRYICRDGRDTQYTTTGNQSHSPAGKDNTPAPAILLTRLKTSVGIVAVPPPVPASPPLGISALGVSAIANFAIWFLLTSVLVAGRPKADTDEAIKKTAQRDSLAKDTMSS
jgi:hypothetical protein